ncbi:hypothetical protein OG21DRAFT_1505150 [Imleria badia]|nr:hypothetical protein OG21DRAFT_1505150 [Imleria badia]
MAMWPRPSREMTKASLLRDVQYSCPLKRPLPREHHTPSSYTQLLVVTYISATTAPASAPLATYNTPSPHNITPARTISLHAHSPPIYLHAVCTDRADCWPAYSLSPARPCSINVSCNHHPRCFLPRRSRWIRNHQNHSLVATTCGVSYTPVWNWLERKLDLLMHRGSPRTRVKDQSLPRHSRGLMAAHA